MPVLSFQDAVPVPRSVSLKNPGRWSGLALALAVVMGWGASPAAACPQWQMTGRQVSYSAGQLLSPQTLSVVAGGDVNLANCQSVPGSGYVITQPDFDLTLSDMSGSAALVLQVAGQCDTVLLVNDSTGRWHFDDDSAGNLQPRIEIAGAQNGVYDIWVGTFAPSNCQATLSLQLAGGQMQPMPSSPPQNQPQNQPPIPPVQPGPSQVPSQGAAPMPTCPQGYVFANGVCEVAQQQPVCPQGYVWTGAVCQPSQQPVCPQGMVFANGVCQSGQQQGQVQPQPGAEGCPAGQERILGVCQNPAGTPVN